MSTRLPLCRRASGRCIVRLCRAFGSLSRPGRGGKAGERAFTREVFRCGLPLTSRISRSYSALCLRSFPALSCLPSGQAQGVAAEDRHNSPRRQSRRLPPPPAGGQHILPIWTAYAPYMDITCHPHGQRMPLICLLYTAHVDSICLICGQRMLHIWTVYTLHMDSACRTQWTGFPAI